MGSSNCWLSAKCQLSRVHVNEQQLFNHSLITCLLLHSTFSEIRVWSYDDTDRRVREVITSFKDAISFTKTSDVRWIIGRGRKKGFRCDLGRRVSVVVYTSGVLFSVFAFHDFCMSLDWVTQPFVSCSGYSARSLLYHSSRYFRRACSNKSQIAESLLAISQDKSWVPGGHHVFQLSNGFSCFHVLSLAIFIKQLTCRNQRWTGFELREIVRHWFRVV